MQKDELDQKDVDKQLEAETRQSGGCRKGKQGGKRRCSNCGKTGHNARTCQEDEEMFNLYDYE